MTSHLASFLELSSKGEMEHFRMETLKAIKRLALTGNKNPTANEVLNEYLQFNKSGYHRDYLRATIQATMRFLGHNPEFVTAQSTMSTTSSSNADLNNFRWNVRNIMFTNLLSTPEAILPYLIARVINFGNYDGEKIKNEIQNAISFIKVTSDFDYIGTPVIKLPDVFLKTRSASSSSSFPSESESLSELENLGIHKKLPELMEFILAPGKYSEIYAKLGTKVAKVCLITFPNGLDMNLIIEKTGQYCGFHVFHCDALDNFQSSRALESNITTVAGEAELHQPSIVHIKNLDTFFSLFNNSPSAKMTHILGFQKTLRNLNTLLIISVESQTALPKEINTPEYISSKIDIPLPDVQDRAGLFKGVVQNLNISSDVLLDTNIHDIVSRIPGYTRYDIVDLMNKASGFAVKRSKSTSELKIELVDILRAIQTAKPLSGDKTSSLIPTVTWNDLGGLFSVKEEIFTSIVYPLKYPETYKSFGIPSRLGLLLYGPPGTGKTMIAKAVANEASANFIAVKPSDILTKWLGESEGKVNQLFEKASKLAPCVLFFDEFETLGTKRTSGEHNIHRNSVITQLLIEMDGINEREGVYLLAATNRLDIIDPAFLRPGRFDRQIYVGLPTKDERRSILEVTLKGIQRNGVVINEDIDLEYLASNTEEYSPADIKGLIQYASSIAARDVVRQMEVGIHVEPEINMSHLMSALLGFKK